MSRGCSTSTTVEARGINLFRPAGRRDLEGIVAKWKRGPYHSDGVQTSWLEIKNPDDSQMTGDASCLNTAKTLDALGRGGGQH